MTKATPAGGAAHPPPKVGLSRLSGEGAADLKLGRACIQACGRVGAVARGRRRPSSAALEPLLQLRLILRDLLSGVAPDQWQEQLAETVALEVEPKRDQLSVALGVAREAIKVASGPGMAQDVVFFYTQRPE